MSDSEDERDQHINEIIKHTEYFAAGIALVVNLVRSGQMPQALALTHIDDVVSRFKEAAPGLPGANARLLDPLVDLCDKARQAILSRS